MDHLNSDSGTMTPASSHFSEDKKGEMGAEKEVISRTVSRAPTPARSFLNACVIVLTVTSSMIINVSANISSEISPICFNDSNTLYFFWVVNSLLAFCNALVCKFNVYGHCGSDVGEGMAT